MTSILEVEQLDTLSSNASSTLTIGGTNTTTIAFGPNVTTTPSSLTNTPAFSAYQQGTGTTLTQNSYTKVVWDSEYFDTDSAFSSGTFTVPSGKAGKYFFTSTVSMQDALAEINIDLYKNGSSYWRGSAIQGSNVASAMSVAGVIDLVAGDYVEVYVKQNISVNKVESGGSHSHFHGYRIIGA